MKNTQNKQIEELYINVINMQCKLQEEFTKWDITKTVRILVGQSINIIHKDWKYIFDNIDFKSLGYCEVPDRHYIKYIPIAEDVKPTKTKKPANNEKVYYNKIYCKQNKWEIGDVIHIGIYKGHLYMDNNYQRYINLFNHTPPINYTAYTVDRHQCLRVRRWVYDVAGIKHSQLKYD